MSAAITIVVPNERPSITVRPLTTRVSMVGRGPQGAGSQNVKSATLILPNSAEDVPMFYTVRAIRISKVIFSATDGSIDWNIEASATRSGSGSSLFSSDQTTDDTTVVITSGFDSAEIAADRFVRLIVTGKTGDVSDIHLTLYFDLI